MGGRTVQQMEVVQLREFGVQHVRPRLSLQAVSSPLLQAKDPMPNKQYMTRTSPQRSISRPLRKPLEHQLPPRPPTGTVGLHPRPRLRRSCAPLRG